jgi:hypothetical protein
VYDVLQWTTSYFYYLTLSKSLLFILSLQALMCMMYYNGRHPIFIT